MNFTEITDITNVFLKEQVIKRKEESWLFYNKIIVIFVLASLFGYIAIIYYSSQIRNIFDVFLGFNLIFFTGISFYLGAFLYYLMTLLHDYVHASQYYSKKASFVIEYIVPILLLPRN